jgi:cytochrome c oxidase subunit IV
MSEHILPKKTYLLVFAALILLTALTTVVAYIDLGPYNTVAALVIAVCKACLVVLFFMHLKYQVGMTRVVLLAAVLWLAILIVLTASDVFTRNWSPTAAPWQQSGLGPKWGRYQRATFLDTDAAPM